MKLDSRGRVTIPKAIREAAGLKPGDDVDVGFEDGKITIARSGPVRTRGRRLVEHMRGPATLKMTTDEIMALTRGEP
ncbi:MAG: AbrB/MazE/SpoVT family DNA-binding domain-containing protein [Armatimonadetes bacterium]|nr:AbrB/MazE/SpoVT family DNA-binding domain-containing protein [Armatimonadota bacterium]